MVAYVIGRMTIHTRDWMDAYFAEVPDLIEKHGGRFLVRGGDPQRLEGQEVLPDATFVIRFDSKEAALGFWNSEEFAPLVALRQTGSHLEAMLVEGVPQEG
ncbi:DUF1330 domain-containing protein [Rhodovibrionaceae bacterium A322]